MLTILNRPAVPALAIAASTVLALAFATPARAAGPDGVTIQFAQDDDANESVILSFDPGQLATPDGVSRLHREIRRAARSVCRSYYGNRLTTDELDCRARAQEDAETSLGVILAKRETATEVASAR